MIVLQNGEWRIPFFFVGRVMGIERSYIGEINRDDLFKNRNVLNSFIVCFLCVSSSSSSSSSSPSSSPSMFSFLGKGTQQTEGSEDAPTNSQSTGSFLNSTPIQWAQMQHCKSHSSSHTHTHTHTLSLSLSLSLSFSSSFSSSSSRRPSSKV